MFSSRRSIVLAASTIALGACAWRDSEPAVRIIPDPAGQRGILREMHDRQGVGGMGDAGKVALTSERAVEIMNHRAKAVHTEIKFHVIVEKPLVPLAMAGGQG